MGACCPMSHKLAHTEKWTRNTTLKSTPGTQMGLVQEDLGSFLKTMATTWSQETETECTLPKEGDLPNTYQDPGMVGRGLQNSPSDEF